MCFSASASFTAAAVLLGLGTVTMRRARSRRELPYAAIPLLFGVQQLLEGMLWLTFPDRAPLLSATYCGMELANDSKVASISLNSAFLPRANVAPNS